MKLPRLLHPAILALCAALLAGSARAAEDTAASLGRAVNALSSRIAFDFGLPADLPIDDGLRSGLEALAAEHRARLAELLATWARDEAPRIESGPHAETDLQMRLFARYFNELSLWQLDTTGDDEDGRLLTVMKDPGTCRELQGPAGALGGLAQLLQRMNPTQREAALSAQRVLLARWGRHDAAPARPDPSLQERALDAARRLRGLERAAEEPALPPVLAWALRKTPAPSLNGRQELCALIAWHLKRASARAAPQTEQALLVRFAFMDEAMGRVQALSPGQRKDGYPDAAARFGVQGEVTAKGQVRADGAGLEAPRIAARRITVPGIRELRPVAFETWLDSASLARAALTPPSGKQAPGAEGQIRFDWKLQ